jgi:hypothetical protein
MTVEPPIATSMVTTLPPGKGDAAAFLGAEDLHVPVEGAFGIVDEDVALIVGGTVPSGG